MTTMPVIIALVHRLLGTVPEPTSVQKAAIQIVDDWIQAKGSLSPNWFLPRTEFADRMKRLLAEPWRLNQGSFPWCLPAAFLYAVLHRFPEIVAQFAIDLYDTGSGRIKDLAIQVPPELMAFDLPKHVRGELAEAPLPSRTAPNSWHYVHADWMLLAALHDHTNSVIDYEGPVDDGGLPASQDADVCRDLFAATGLYNSVRSEEVTARLTLSDIEQRLRPDDRTDLVLVGAFSLFTRVLESPKLGINMHAVTLSRPPVFESGQMKTCFYSWGDAAAAEQVLNPVTQSLQLDLSLSDIRAHLWTIIVARAA